MTAKKIEAALKALTELGLPKAQLNNRSALVLLALTNLKPQVSWRRAEPRLVGVTPIMEWIELHYRVRYAPNTRETIRRQTLHQFVQAGIVEYNPDAPARPVNSPKAVYQISNEALITLREFGSEKWAKQLAIFHAIRPKLVETYEAKREFAKILVSLPDGEVLKLSPGDHSQLIAKIISDFASRFLPGSKLLYAGDTGSKHSIFDEKGFAACGLTINLKGKLPDVVFRYMERDWLVLVEAVTSHGPMNPKRVKELRTLLDKTKLGLVFVSAFPNERTFGRYSSDIAWETEVWIASKPNHMIHFNGKRFLGPY